LSTAALVPVAFGDPRDFAAATSAAPDRAVHGVSYFQAYTGHVVYVPGVWNKFTVWLIKALPRPWGAAMVRKQSARFRRKTA